MSKLLNLQHPLILASASPRRRVLLQQLNLEFSVQPAHIDEDALAEGKSPVEYVNTLALAKARAVAADHADAWVIGADTIVVLDDQILNKPANANDAFGMLLDLSGRTHHVFSAYAVVDAASKQFLTGYRKTAVEFRHLERAEIREYVDGGSPLDKAGAYGIQDDFGAVFVREIRGCYYNVVGMPLESFYGDLRRLIAGGFPAQRGPI